MTVVAIDGPAGAGKSTVARAVAEALGWRHVDTGAMYRAVTLAALVAGVPLEDAERVEEIARAADIAVEGPNVTLDGRDVTEEIRGPEVSAAVPVVSAHPGVRSALVERQRRLAARSDVVMEGRDIGTVVVPEAPVKIFLTAALQERARRRARELMLPEDDASIASTGKALGERDDTDSRRASSPLACADDALVVDTTDRSVGEITRLIVELVGERDPGGR